MSEHMKPKRPAKLVPRQKSYNRSRPRPRTDLDPVEMVDGPDPAAPTPEHPEHPTPPPPNIPTQRKPSASGRINRRKDLSRDSPTSDRMVSGTRTWAEVWAIAVQGVADLPGYDEGKAYATLIRMRTKALANREVIAQRRATKDAEFQARQQARRDRDARARSKRPPSV